MTWLRILRSRIATLFRVDRGDAELDEELRFHLEMEEAENRRKGMSASDARRAARLSLGGVEGAKGAYRDQQGLPWLEEFWRDVRFGNRILVKSPGFATVAVLSLALAIGASTTVFSVANAVLFRDLPVEEPGRLVSVHRTRNGGISSSSHSYPNYLEFNKQTDVFSGVAAYCSFVPANLGGDDPQRVWGQLVSGNYFSVLGVEAIAGRTIVPEENEDPGAHSVMVISYELWRNQFNSDRGVVGRTVLLSGHPFTVVGVAPQGFWGVSLGLTPQFWAPIMMREELMPGRDGQDILSNRGSNWLDVIGGLNEDVSEQEAQASIDLLATRLSELRLQEIPAAERPSRAEAEKSKRGLALTPATAMSPRARELAMNFLVILSAVVGFVLLIGCVNVTNLLLARGAVRGREVALRIALGAGRVRLIRQLLSENLSLALLGGALGFALAYWATASLSGVDLAVLLPVDFELRPDARVAAFAIGISILTVLGSGLAPAWRSARLSKSTTRPSLAGRLQQRPRFGLSNILVVSQLTLSVILLVSTGLFLRSLQNEQSVDVGFRADDVLLLGFDPKLQGYSGEGARAFLNEVRSRVGGLPRVRSVSMVNLVPVSGGSNTTMIEAEGREAPKRRQVTTFLVGPDYLDTMGMRLIRGKSLDEAGNVSPIPTLINETMKSQYWPGEDSVGRLFRSGDDRYQVVGVVADSKATRLAEGPTACMYHSLLDRYDQNSFFVGMTLLVKADGDPAELAEPVRGEIAAIDPNLPVYGVRTMNQHLKDALVLPRLTATVFGVVGVMGLLLASMGLFGVIHYSVNRRTQEIGVRMALGAHASNILRHVLARAMILASVGIVLGTAGGLAFTRVLSRSLYGVSATDPATFVAASVLLTLVALLAGYIPARRASRVQPMTALRYE